MRGGKDKKQKLFFSFLSFLKEQGAAFPHVTCEPSNFLFGLSLLMERKRKGREVVWKKEIDKRKRERE